MTPIRPSVLINAQSGIPPQKFLRESVAPEPMGDTLNAEEAVSLVQGRRVADTFTKEKELEKEEHSEDLDQDRDDDFEEESDRSDPFETESESDCLDRGSDLSDFTEFEETKVEECRPSDAPYLVFRNNSKEESPDKKQAKPNRYKDSSSRVFQDESAS